MSDDTFDKDMQDATDVANPDDTIATEPTDQTVQEAEPVIDYKQKFVDSSKEALRLREENKRLLGEMESLDKAQQDEGVSSETMENMYPGFVELDDDAQKTLLEYTLAVTNKAKEEMYKDPAIAFARKTYNEKVWDEAFDKVVTKYPELKDAKSDFKSKYFNVNNVPSNIDAILDDVSKIYLFDKTRKTTDEIDTSERVETERATGGDKSQPVGRSLEDWQTLARENPAKFASMSKQFQSDLESGKLTE